MNYFISPPEKSDWRLSAREFLRQLTCRWPNAVVQEQHNPESNHLVDFDVSMQHSRLIGALSRSGRALILDAAIEDCVQMALWFRSIVPASQALIFYDESFSFSIALEEGTSEEDVLTVSRDRA